MTKIRKADESWINIRAGVMTQAAFAFTGTEVVAIAAGEARNPRSCHDLSHEDGGLKWRFKSR